MISELEDLNPLKDSHKVNVISYLYEGEQIGTGLSHCVSRVSLL